jgi:hypothetical protein
MDPIRLLLNNTADQSRAYFNWLNILGPNTCFAPVHRFYRLTRLLSAPGTVVTVSYFSENRPEKSTDR